MLQYQSAKRLYLLKRLDDYYSFPRYDWVRSPEWLVLWFLSILVLYEYMFIKSLFCENSSIMLILIIAFYWLYFYKLLYR